MKYTWWKAERKTNQGGEGGLNEWLPAPKAVWQPIELPQPSAHELAQGEKREVALDASIISIGEKPSRAVWNCLTQLSSDLLLNLDAVKWFSFSQFTVNSRYQYHHIENVDRLFELISRVNNRERVIIVSEVTEEVMENVIRCLNRIKKYYDQVFLFLITPNLSDEEKTLANLREIGRYTVKAPHLFRIDQDEEKKPTIEPIKDEYGHETQVVDYIFLCGESETNLEETLFVFNYPGTSNEILQNLHEIINKNFDIYQQMNTLVLNTCSTATLYFPKSEHAAYIRMQILWNILYGIDESKKGYFNQERNKVLNKFVNINKSRYYHSLFKSLFEINCDKNLVQFPDIQKGEINNYYKAFVYYFADFINQAFTSGDLSFRSFTGFVKDLSSRTEKILKCINKNSNLNDLINKINIFIKKFAEHLDKWERAVFKNEDQKYRITQKTNSSRETISLEEHMGNEIDNAKKKLKQRNPDGHRILILDVNYLQEDSNFEDTIKEIKDNIQKDLQWRVDFDGLNNLSLWLYLADQQNWKKFSFDQLITTDFQTAIEALVYKNIDPKIIELEAHYSADRFVQMAIDNKSDLEIIKIPIIRHDNENSLKLNYLCCINNYLNNIDPNNYLKNNDPENRYKHLSEYSLFRISALRIEGGIPLSETSLLYNNNWGKYLSSIRIHKSEEEKLAWSIEKTLSSQLHIKTRMLSPAICSAFTDTKAVEVFFKCLFSGKLIWKTQPESQHVWSIKCIENWGEVYLMGGRKHEMFNSLQKSFMEFLTKRYYKIEINQTNSPFHSNNWNSFLETLSQYRYELDSVIKIMNGILRLTDNNLARIDSPDVDVDEYFYTPLFAYLQNQKRWMEWDFLAVMYYYDKKLKPKTKERI